MGQQAGKLRVLTLNYSSILLSPFEFYAVDNWQELEKIGIIFEENLRRDFEGIKREVEAVSPGDAPREEYYVRSSFDWRVDKIDKDVKRRYSPLYIERTDREYLDSVLYPGVAEDCRFMDRQAFDLRWQQEYRYEGKDFGKAAYLMCRRFDFECYRAFVQYLYNREENLGQLPLSRREREEQEKNVLAEFQEIIESINSEPLERRVALVGIYRQFMRSYFQRIDVPTKLEKTRQYLFEQNELDLINLQQANNDILREVCKQEKYFTFSPLDSLQNEDQCLILLRKDSPLVPPYFRQHYPSEQQAVQQVRNALFEAISNYQSFCSSKARLRDIIEGHFNRSNAEDILSALDNTPPESAFPSFGKRLKDLVLSSLGNPLRAEFEEWTMHYKEQFLAYWGKVASTLQKRESAILLPALEEIREKGLLHWYQGFTLATFCFSDRRLQALQEDARLIIGSFHLSSKEIKNRVQIQILGLLVYEVVRRGYRIVFSGDFNSHVVLREKESEEGLFTFLKHFYAGSEFETAAIARLQGEEGLWVFPKHPMIFTTKKKRTILQVQGKKSNKLATKCIDQVISNLPILYNECYSGEIAFLGSSENRNKNFIPHKDHPYDHFAVEAVLQLPPAQPRP